MSKKIIICLALMCALIMTACANPEPGEQVPGDDQPVGTTPADTTPAETTPSATETTAPATDPTKITVSLDGTTDYMIIRADNAQSTIVSAAAKLFLKLKYDVGIQTKINTDWAKDESTIDLSIQGVEPENISLVEGEFIIGCNNASWSGGVVYRLNIQKKQ